LPRERPGRPSAFDRDGRVIGGHRRRVLNASHRRRVIHRRRLIPTRRGSLCGCIRGPRIGRRRFRARGKLPSRGARAAVDGRRPGGRTPRRGIDVFARTCGSRSEGELLALLPRPSFSGPRLEIRAVARGRPARIEENDSGRDRSRRPGDQPASSRVETPRASPSRTVHPGAPAVGYTVCPIVASPYPLGAGGAREVRPFAAFHERGRLFERAHVNRCRLLRFEPGRSRAHSAPSSLTGRAIRFPFVDLRARDPRARSAPDC
jgi:hypothetical protein